LLEQALEIRKKTRSERSTAYIVGLSNLAMVSKAQGDLPHARKQLEEVLAMSQEVEGPKSLGAARGHYNLAALLLELGDLEPGKRHLQNASELFEQLLGRENEHYALALSQRAYVSWVENDMAGALESLEQSVSIFSELLYRALPALSEREQRSLLNRALP